jgi:hypothetical protein
MAIVGGLLAVPLFLIMNLLSGDEGLTSFMGILASRYDSSFDFYSSMFNQKW